MRVDAEGTAVSAANADADACGGTKLRLAECGSGPDGRGCVAEVGGGLVGGWCCSGDAAV